MRQSKLHQNRATNLQIMANSQATEQVHDLQVPNPDHLAWARGSLPEGSLFQRFIISG